MKFKKGDKIQNTPTGHVGSFIADNGDHVTVSFNHCLRDIAKWHKNHIRLLRDPSPVIEAANKAVDWCQNDLTISAKEWADELRNALAAYDGEQPEDEEDKDMDDYKWLAMDDDICMVFLDQPSWCGDDCVVTGWAAGCACKSVEKPPSWIKPKQLWERVPYIRCHQQDGVRCWYGYGWELAEDHSTHISHIEDSSDTHNESAWITDREPEEKDYWKDDVGRKWVMIYEDGEVLFSEYPWSGDEAWMSVPQCLRTPPNEPKC